MHRWLPIFVLSISAAAQVTPPATPSAQSPIRLPLTITAKDKAKPSIDKRLVEIYDNGAPTSAFDLRAPAATGLDLVLLIDISGSSRNRINATRKIAERVTETLNARGDRAYVGLFNDEFAFSKKKLNRQEIDSLLGRTCFHGPTALFDAVAAASQLLRDEQGENRHAILVVSDGDDNASRSTMKFAIEAAVREGATVSSINLVSARMGDSGSGGKTLKELAESTGGTRLEASDWDELAKCLDQWERLLDSQYELRFVPPAGTTERFHKIEIRTGDKNLRVTAPRGYYFGPPLTQAELNRTAPAPAEVRLTPEEAQRLVTKMTPPRKPRGQQMKGSVLVYVTVDKKGRVASAIAPCADPALGQLAAEAVQQWRYTPYMLNGRPVQFYTKVALDVGN